MKKYDLGACANNMVEMSKSGWKKLGKLNGRLGKRFICVPVLCGELAEYLDRHDAVHAHLDTEYQELRYDEGICLVVSKSQGVWYVIDLWLEERMAVSYMPIYLWRRIQKGCRKTIERVLIGWQSVRKEMRCDMAM